MIFVHSEKIFVHNVAVLYKYIYYYIEMYKNDLDVLILALFGLFVKENLYKFGKFQNFFNSTISDYYDLNLIYYTILSNMLD